MTSRESPKSTTPQPGLFERRMLGPPICKGTSVDGLEYGPDERLVEQVITYSNSESDKDLREATSDKERCKEVDAYTQRDKKGSFPFELTDERGILASLIWYGPAQPPMLNNQGRPEPDQKWDTIAFRSYPPFRGQGLMRAFVDAVLRRHASDRPDHNMWLSVKAENMRAQELYRSLGFVPKSIPPNSGEIFMSLSKKGAE